MSPDTFSSTEPRQGKYKRRKLQKDNKTDKTFTFNTIPSPPSSFGSSFPSCQLPSELLLLPVVMDEDECRPPGCLLDVVAPTCGNRRGWVPTTRLAAWCCCSPLSLSGSFLPPSPPRDPPSQVVILTPSFQSLVDPPFMCVCLCLVTSPVTVTVTVSYCCCPPDDHLQEVGRSFWQPQNGHEKCILENLHIEIECVLSVKESRFQWKNG